MSEGSGFGYEARRRLGIHSKDPDLRQEHDDADRTPDRQSDDQELERLYKIKSPKVDKGEE